MDNKTTLELIINLGSIIAETFGNNCEVAISKDKKVIAIFNGHITNRKIGSHIGEYAEKRIDSAADNTLINYAKNIGDTKIKSSTLTFNLDGSLISFCINYDYSLMDTINKELVNFLNLNKAISESSDVKLNSDVTLNSYDQMEAAFNKFVESIGRPVHLFSKDDRLMVVKHLADQGFLDISKSIVNIAKLLGVTRYTIYNYLKELGIQRYNEE